MTTAVIRVWRCGFEPGWLRGESWTGTRVQRSSSRDEMGEREM